MTTPAHSDSSPRVRPTGRVDWITALAVAPLVVLFMATAWSALGATLGLLYAGIGLLTAVLPGVAAHAQRRRPILLGSGIAVVLVAGFWLPLIPDGAITVGQWTGCVLVAAGYAVALSGGAWMLGRRLDSSVAAAIVTLAALAWLSWPVWTSFLLSTASGEAFAGWLVFAHPLFAVNGLTFERLGVWTQQPLMYNHLTPLGQDVAYELPNTVWPCVILHGAIGAAFVARVSRK